MGQGHFDLLSGTHRDGELDSGCGHEPPDKLLCDSGSIAN